MPWYAVGLVGRSDAQAPFSGVPQARVAAELGAVELGSGHAPIEDREGLASRCTPCARAPDPY